MSLGLEAKHGSRVSKMKVRDSKLYVISHLTHLIRSTNLGLRAFVVRKYTNLCDQKERIKALALTFLFMEI